MRLSTLFLFISCVAFSCNQGRSIPDVSNIKIDLTTLRFEEELFGLDSSAYKIELDKLQARYPSFGENFITTILGADPKWKEDSITAYVRGFVKAFKNVYNSSQVLFKDFTPYEKEIKKGLQFVKYYFPSYVAPKRIITYIGPLDGFGDILSDDAIVVGLHHHLGKNYSLYQSGLVQETYAGYISNRFEPEYIVVNCLKNIVLDMYPEKMDDKPLIQQMVEKGKKLYALSRLLPNTAEYKLIGYTSVQLEESYAHERIIWDLFVQHNFLQTIDNNIIKNYVGEGPKTQELGESSPGNIGSFSGWQIVKKYVQKYPEINLSQLMATEAETIFQEAKYKP